MDNADGRRGLAKGGGKVKVIRNDEGQPRCFINTCVRQEVCPYLSLDEGHGFCWAEKDFVVALNDCDTPHPRCHVLIGHAISIYRQIPHDACPVYRMEEEQEEARALNETYNIPTTKNRRSRNDAT